MLFAHVKSRLLLQSKLCAHPDLERCKVKPKNHAVLVTAPANRVPKQAFHGETKLCLCGLRGFGGTLTIINSTL